MPVGILRASLRLRGVHSLKEKRGVLMPILARLRAERFAAAEVDQAGRWQSSVIEVACVNSVRAEAEAALDRALGIIERGGEVEVVDHSRDVT